MFKKNFLLLCALTAAYAPVIANAPEVYREEDIVDVTKGKKCCKCCSLTVTNNATIGGNLTVRGSVTAGSFISSATGLPIAGLRNWAVFSNQTVQATGTTAVIPFGAIPLFSNQGITNTGGNITLPATGLFLVMYSVRVRFAPSDVVVSASAELQQGDGTTFANITQPAIILSTQSTALLENLDTQITGYAIVSTTSTANNQIHVLLALDTGVSLPSTGSNDANAEITILQLN